MKSEPPPAASATTPTLEVNISADLASVDVMHHGRMVTIMRNQNPDNAINPEYAKTARKCRRGSNLGNTLTAFQRRWFAQPGAWLPVP